MELVVNDYNKLRIRFALSSSVILLTSKSISVLHHFIQTVLKEREQCYLLEQDTKKIYSLADYNVDYIDDEFSRTSLSIEEYLSFFGLANRMFSDSFVKDIEVFLSDNGLQKYKDEPLCNMTALVQLKTRLFISGKRNAKFIILSNNDGGIEDKDLLEITGYIQLFCEQHNMIAIITTRSTPLTEAYTGKRITL